MRRTINFIGKKSGDTIYKGTVGVVQKYYKEPVAKVGFEKPVVLEIDWGMPPVNWHHSDLCDIVIREH